ncbi:MAG: iron-containing alcohol dehydrogenase [Culicoidibacterales bacterium]
MQNFINTIDTTIYFGKDSVNYLKSASEQLGDVILLTYGGGSIKSIGLYDKVMEQLKGKTVIELSGISANPKIESVEEGVALCKAHGVTGILAVGGGSVMDASKAIALGSVLPDGTDMWHDVVKKMGQVGDDVVALPLGVVVTLAATGSESNMGGVISNMEVGEKLVFFHGTCRPKFAIEDPTVLFSLPDVQTAAGIFDTLSHLLEQYFLGTHEDEGLVDRQAEALIRSLWENSRDIWNQKDNYDVRAQLLYLSTLALNNSMTHGRIAGRWIVHPMEHALSAINDMTHGIGLGILHPKVLKMYVEKDIKAGNPLTKFVNLGKNAFDFTGSDEEIANQVVDHIQKWALYLNVPMTLNDGSISDAELDALLEKSLMGNDTLGSYLPLTRDEIALIFKQSIQ